MPRLVLGEPLQSLQVSEFFISFLGSIFWNVLLDYCIIIAFALSDPTFSLLRIADFLLGHFDSSDDRQ